MFNMLFGIIVSSRRFFNEKLSTDGRKKLLSKLNQMGYDYIVLNENEMDNGLVSSIEDAQKCVKLFKENKDKIKGIIVSLPNFGDEVAVSYAIQASDLNVPVLVHAWDDDIDNMSVENRRDAFCGKLSVCNNLYQLGIKFTNTTLHTCSVDSLEFQNDLKAFNSICNIVNNLKNINVLQIGTRPAAFRTVRYSEKLLQRHGINIVPVDLSEVISFANKLKDDDQIVIDALEKIQNYGAIEINDESKLIKSAKLLAAIIDFIKSNNCVAGAIQCWDSLQYNYGCAACLPMSILTESGIPFACETDIMGALSMLVLAHATGVPSGYVDWNNNYYEDRDKCVAFHCSAYPKSFLGNQPTIGTLNILGATLGYENCFGCIKGKVAAGDMTYLKISTDDIKGEIKLYVGEGEFTDDPIETCGAYAVCHVPNLQQLMNYLTNNGFEHHVAMGRGHVAKIISESLGKYLGWNVYWHK